MDHKETRAVRAQLAEIINSSDFTASDRLKDFLTYVVERTLEGRENTLKAYTIAVEVFGMREDFDPRLNPLVRMEASRLRSKLDHYYLRNPGAPVYINMPKGGYSAVFSTNTAAQSSRARKLSARTPFTHEDNYVSSILLAPLINIDGSKTTEMFIQGLALEINHALTKFKQLKIIDQTSRLAALPPDGEAEASLKKRPRFVLKGSAQIESDQCLAWISLIDSSTNYNLWAEKFSGDLTETHVFKLQTRIAEAVSFNISDDFGLINRTLLQEYGSDKGESPSIQQAHVLYWHFASMLTRDSLKNALRSVEFAARKEPNNAQIQAMLADIYAFDYEAAFGSVENGLEKAVQLLARAIGMDPECQLAHLTMAFTHFLRGDKERLLASGIKAYDLNPSSGNTLASLAQWYGIMGNWDATLELLEKLVEQSPSFPGWCNAILSLYHYVHGNPETALKEAEKNMAADTFWSPMFRLVSGAALGDKAATDSALADMLGIYPNFKENSLQIIRRYTPNPEYFALFRADLEKAGLV